MNIAMRTDGYKSVVDVKDAVKVIMLNHGEIFSTEAKVMKILNTADTFIAGGITFSKTSESKGLFTRVDMMLDEFFSPSNYEDEAGGGFMKLEFLVEHAERYNSLTKEEKKEYITKKITRLKEVKR